MKRRVSRSTLRVAVRDASEVGAARRAALSLARTHDFSDVQSGKIALVATELANNLVRHAGSGDLLYQVLELGRGVPVLELVAVDSGPGMADPSRCLDDGYSTGGTSGTGLGAVQRQSDEFDLYSQPGRGTVVLSRIGARPDARWSSPAVRFGALAIPHPRETVCGDTWQLCELPDRRVLLTVIDGIGHGLLAAQAADAAERAFCPSETLTPDAFLHAAHAALKGTRGAAVACALVDWTQECVAFAGVGNIGGCVVHDGSSRGLMSHYGTLGQAPSKIQQLVVPFPPGATLVLHSDGLQSRWDSNADRGIGAVHPMLIAAGLWRDFSRNSDDCTVCIVDAAPAARVVGSSAEAGS